MGGGSCLWIWRVFAKGCSSFIRMFMVNFQNEENLLSDFLPLIPIRHITSNGLLGHLDLILNLNIHFNLNTDLSK